jgi:hypothetical protein
VYNGGFALQRGKANCQSAKLLVPSVSVLAQPILVKTHGARNAVAKSERAVVAISAMG